MIVAGSSNRELSNMLQIKKIMTVFLHVMYTFQSESTLYSCMNVKDLLARNRRDNGFPLISAPGAYQILKLQRAALIRRRH